MLNMEVKATKATLYSLVLTLIITLATAAFNDYNDKILLSDVKVLTLHQGQMTNARRSPAVPQLKCVGGSAQYKFTPRVVQCYNRGSDGYDIQWECKTDMDNAYRFGNVEVTCEGYDYPNDPFILKGSCGLEYTIDFTEEGEQREREKGGYSYHNSYNKKHSSEGGIGGLFVFGGVLFAMYVIYKTCIAPSATRAGGPTPSAPNADQPPPYGFRPEYMQDQHPQGPPPPYDSTGPQGSTFSSMFSGPGSGFGAHPKPHCNRGSTGGGFWTGAATGGLLGYLFGRGNNNYNRGAGWGNSGWGSSGWGGTQNHSTGSGSFFSSTPSRGSSSSSGTRTASGFGGTSRR